MKYVLIVLVTALISFSVVSLNNLENDISESISKVSVEGVTVVESEKFLCGISLSTAPVKCEGSILLKSMLPVSNPEIILFDNVVLYLNPLQQENFIAEADIEILADGFGFEMLSTQAGDTEVLSKMKQYYNENLKNLMFKNLKIRHQKETVGKNIETTTDLSNDIFLAHSTVVIPKEDYNSSKVFSQRIADTGSFSNTFKIKNSSKMKLFLYNSYKFYTDLLKDPTAVNRDFLGVDTSTLLSNAEFEEAIASHIEDFKKQDLGSFNEVKIEFYKLYKK